MKKSKKNPVIKKDSSVREKLTDTHWKIILWISMAALIIISMIPVTYWVLNNPSINLLIPEGGAQWIRLSEPFLLNARPDNYQVTFFRKQFTVNKTLDHAVLVVRAMKAVAIYLDGVDLRGLHTPLDLDSWKKPIRVYLPLTPGNHELKLMVINRTGHGAVLAYCKTLGITTDTSWNAGAANNEGKWDGTWSTASLVNEPASVWQTHIFPSVWDSFKAKLPVFLIIFILVYVFTIVKNNQRPAFLARMSFNASHLRFLLLCIWTILACNNIFKLPAALGFDLEGHIEYIRYVADNMSLPYASDGWQMFQAPLFYVLSAVVYKAFSGFLNNIPMEQILRVLPMLFGALQIELGYRTMKLVFPNRNNLQIIGTWICGTMPMNIYMSQIISNEPLAGLLSAIVLFLCIKGIIVPNNNSIRSAAILGLFLGLALLSKAHAIVLIPIVAIRHLMMYSSEAKMRKNLCKPFLTMAGVAFLVAGWYYIRNWIKLGKPFVGGWDTYFITWWQDPGYRTIESFTRFGQSLIYPVYSSVQGFWDATYSTMWMDATMLSKIYYQDFPPWNFDFMIAGAWLAAPITLAIIIGMIKSSSEINRRVLDIARISVALYFIALLYMFLSLPTFSAGKVTYTLGLLPFYGMFAALGLRPFLANKWLKGAVYGWITCFGVSAYCSYFSF
ncbi:MAG TPA: hypothetical protein VMU29_04530 [Smithella sp.]|nr:hypothetical protein [Smithella sp.]